MAGILKKTANQSQPGYKLGAPQRSIDKERRQKKESKKMDTAKTELRYNERELYILLVIFHRSVIWVININMHLLESVCMRESLKTTEKKIQGKAKRIKQFESSAVRSICVCKEGAMDETDNKTKTKRKNETER